MSEPHRGLEDAGPGEPDVDPELAPIQGSERAGPFDQPARSRVRLHLDVIGVVFAGGCIGGWVRYLVVTTWPTEPDRFPWSTVAVNLPGAFVLALVVVLAADVRPSRYLRPLLGTGFCGALTTFSSVVVSAVQLTDGGHVDVAASYLVVNIVGGLATGALGLLVGRAIAANRHRSRQKGRR